MAKLYFRYGTVYCAKTLNLVAVAHNYEEKGCDVVLCVPQLDTRFGVGVIKTKAGLVMDADVVIFDKESVPKFLDTTKKKPVCVLVDEAQFLNKDEVDSLREVVTERDIPVICYGLRADFRTKLFQGSKRLFEVADVIEEVKTVCHYCNKKATMNLKFVNGAVMVNGPSVELDDAKQGAPVYKPACWACYKAAIKGKWKL